MAATKKGETMISFLIFAPLFLVLLSGLISGAALTLAECFMALDTYTLARAHLYGNDLNYCEASRHWPQLEALRINYQCPMPGTVLAELKMNQRTLIERKLRLQ